MFTFPALAILTIAATRMYRSLSDFSSTSAGGLGSDNFFSAGSGAGSTAVFKANNGSRVPADAISLKPMEVVVHKTFDLSQTTVAQTTSQ